MSDTVGKIRVFVYGTLKHGHCNHPALAKAEFLGRCAIEGRFRLFDLGWYPGLVKSTGENINKVSGEVYAVDDDTLAALDMIEGHPSYYERTKVTTPWKKAWVYLLPEEYEKRDLEECTDGMWRPTEDERAFVDGAPR